MALVLAPITLTNLVFDLIILCLGLFAYAKMKRKSAVGLWMGVGFTFFAVSYIVTVLGYGSSTIVLEVLRVLGYLSVIVSLCVYMGKR